MSLKGVVRIWDLSDILIEVGRREKGHILKKQMTFREDKWAFRRIDGKCGIL